MTRRRLRPDPRVIRGAIFIWMLAEGLGVEQARRRCGLSRTTFWRARNGRPLTLDNRRAIAAAIGWPPTAFLRLR